jgi:hypothetical protein
LFVFKCVKWAAKVVDLGQKAKKKLIFCRQRREIRIWQLWLAYFQSAGNGLCAGISCYGCRNPVAAGLKNRRQEIYFACKDQRSSQSVLLDAKTHLGLFCAFLSLNMLMAFCLIFALWSVRIESIAGLLMRIAKIA